MDPAVVYGEWPYPDYPPYYWEPPSYIGYGLLGAGLAFGTGWAVANWGNYWGGDINWGGGGDNIINRPGGRPSHPISGVGDKWRPHVEHHREALGNRGPQRDFRGSRGQQVLKPGNKPGGGRTNVGSNRPNKGQNVGSNRPNKGQKVSNRGNQRRRRMLDPHNVRAATRDKRPPAKIVDQAALPMLVKERRTSPIAQEGRTSPIVQAFVLVKEGRTSLTAAALIAVWAAYGHRPAVFGSGAADLAVAVLAVEVVVFVREPWRTINSSPLRNRKLRSAKPKVR